MLNSFQPRTNRSRLERTEDKLYFPHPAPDAVIDENQEQASKMGAAMSLLKARNPQFPLPLFLLTDVS